MLAVAHALNGILVPLFGLREPVSALTHLAGAALSIAGGVLLWRRARGDRVKQASMLVYATGLTLLYLASAAYHMAGGAPERIESFRRADHAAIFLLIAGTFTPFYVNALEGRRRAANLLMIWGIAFAGIALKIAWIDMPDGPSAAIYVGMGWLAIFSYARLAARLSHTAMALALAGGVIYTLGAVGDVVEWPVPMPGFFGFHETFHVMVMLASAVHFLVVLRFVAPLARADAARVVPATTAPPCEARERVPA